MYAKFICLGIQLDSLTGLSAKLTLHHYEHFAHIIISASQRRTWCVLLELLGRSGKVNWKTFSYVMTLECKI